MTSSSVIPIKDTGSMPTHGRIRAGDKSGKGGRTALTKWRLTSVDKTALEQLAKRYGGEVKAWKDPKANPPNQWQLYTDSTMLNVIVTPGSVDVAYELWRGGSLARRCDGETCHTWEYTAIDSIQGDEPCICYATGLLECSAKTRVNFMFPDIRFAGVWRYESSGKNALHSLPSMLNLIEALQMEGGLVPVEFHLVPQERTKGKQKRKYIVAEIRTNVSIDQMLDGSGSYRPQIGPSGTVPALDSSTSTNSSSGPSTEISPPTPVSISTPSEPGSSSESMTVDEDEIVDAEIVEEDDGVHGPMPRREALAMAKESGGTLKASKNPDGDGWLVR